MRYELEAETLAQSESSVPHSNEKRYIKLPHQSKKIVKEAQNTYNTPNPIRQIAPFTEVLLNYEYEEKRQYRKGN